MKETQQRKVIDAIEHIAYTLKKSERTSSKIILFAERKEKQKMLNDYFSKCCFCPKVFYDSTFLIRHLLRRHSENILSLHKQLCDANRSNCEISSSDQKNFINFFCKEFSKFREELEIIKQDIYKEEKANQFSREPTKQKDFFKVSETSSSRIEIKQSDQKNLFNFCCREFLRFREELEIVKQFIFKQEKTFQFHKESVENKDFLKASEPSSEGRSEENERICEKLNNLLLNFRNHEELMNTFLLELKCIISSNLEGNKLMRGDCISDINARFEKLEHLIVLNFEKANFNIAQELERKFDHEILTFLNSTKAKKEKRKQSSHHKSLKHLSASESVRKKEILKTNSSFHTDSTSKCQPIHTSKKVHIIKNIALLLEEKLNSLNIPLGIEHLSSEDFEKKIRLVQSESEVLSKKYKSFSEYRQYWNLLADEKTRHKIEGKNYKRVRFQETAENFPLVENNEIDYKNSPSANSSQEKTLLEQGSSSVSNHQFHWSERPQFLKTTLNEGQNSSASFKVIHRPKPLIEESRNFSLTSLADLSLIDNKSSSDSD